jgi:pimeloyl-ACP methyl ester carboxylesterase
VTAELAADGERVTTRGVELSYSERGAGVPVALVHETATSGDVWSTVARAIGERARAISYDRRGWGSSTAPDGYQRTTIEEQSEDLAELLQALDASPAVVCGTGIGAVIALDLLLRRPELVVGGLLIEPPVFGLLPEATEALSEDRVELERAVADSGAVGALGLYLSGGLQALGAGTGRLPSALTADARERPGSVFAELGASSAWAMPLLRFAAAERPSVIVSAPSTPPLLREAGKALAARLASSETVDLDVARTPPHVGAPDEVAKLGLGLAG